MTFNSRLKTSTASLGRFVVGATLGLGLIAALAGVPRDALAQAAPIPTPAPAAAPPMATTVVPAVGEGPALWAVRDADSTLYLFGTLHVLKAETPWGSPKVDAAFAEADSVIFEISNPDDQAALMPMVQRYGLSPDRPLSSLLTPEEIVTLDAAAQTLGATAAQLDPMRPWLVATQLAAAALVKAGYDPQQGVERVFKARAEAAGKPITGLETIDEQIGIIAGLDEPTQLAMLRASLEEYDEAEALIGTMVDDWATADLEGLEATVITDMRAQSEDMYQAMIVRRNTNWADQIQTLLAGSGTVFIAVGSGHLIGDDSVQSMLEDRGVTVTRE